MFIPLIRFPLLWPQNYMLDFIAKNVLLPTPIEVIQDVRTIFTDFHETVDRFVSSSPGTRPWVLHYSHGDLKFELWKYHAFEVPGLMGD